MSPRFMAAWFLGLVLALSLGFVVWRTAPVSSDDARLALAAAPLVVWGILLLVLAGGASARPGAGPELGADAIAAGGDAVRRLRETLRLRRLAGRHQRYRVPLFVLLGPPGVGKSSLLERSGLDLEPPREVEGTTWWIGSEAIFVEAASGLGDASGLAAMLKRFRPALPVNGVVVAMSPADLVLADTLERREQGEAVARALAALEAGGRRPPVYVVLTKMDLAPGFTEAFGSLDPSERNKVWGYSLPLDFGDAPAAPAEGTGAFRAGLRQLMSAVKVRLAHGLPAVGEPLHGGRLANFGAQVAAMGLVIEEVLKPLMPSEVRRRRGALLRGVYLTSAQQEALTLDVLLPELAPRYAMPRSGTLPPDLDMHEVEHGFFIARLMRVPLLQEAGLVGRVKAPWHRRGSFGVGLLFVVATGVLLASLWLRVGVSEAQTRLARFDGGAAAINAPALGARALDAPTLSGVSATLERLRALGGETVGAGPWEPLLITARLPAAAAARYEAALRNVLRPHLKARLEAGLVDLDADTAVLKDRIAAATADAPGRDEALSRWLRDLAASLDGGEPSRAVFLDQAKSALALGPPLTPDPVYLETAQRILAYKESLP